MKRGSQLQRKKRMKRQRVQKRSRPNPVAIRVLDHLADVLGGLRDSVRRAWVATLPCLICGNHNTFACHTVNGGTAYKGTDQGTVPLCLVHHDEYDGRRKLANGWVGKKAFEVFYSINMAEQAAQFSARYEQEMMQPK